MHQSITRTAAGFVAGALAVAVFHQGMYLLLKQSGVPLSGRPWNFAPAPQAFGMPTLFNQMFWGGAWGVLFAHGFERWPGDRAWLKGLLFGIVFPMLLGSWLLVAAIKGQPLFAGFLIDFNPVRLRNGFLLNGVALGIGIGVLYPSLHAIFARGR